jgi:hypothetical protein
LTLLLQAIKDSKAQTFATFGKTKDITDSEVMPRNAGLTIKVHTEGAHWEQILSVMDSESGPPHELGLLTSTLGANIIGYGL